MHFETSHTHWAAHRLRTGVRNEGYQASKIPCLEGILHALIMPAQSIRTTVPFSPGYGMVWRSQARADAA